MKYLFTICFLFTATISFSQKKSKKTSTDPFSGLDTAFQRVLKDQKIAGFAVAVVEKNKVIYAKGFGYRDYEKKLPVTANTLFAIGSCTKAFTASLLGLLNKEDKIEFNKPVRQYLPELEFYNNDMNNLITVKDMMCHRTGLPRHDYSWYLFKTSSRDSLLQRIKYQEPTAAVRETWQYNNFMFLAQGMIAEKLTGKSWEDNVKEKIFAPLGMNRSNFSIKDMEKSNDASLGYRIKDDSIIKKTKYYNIDAMGPAGSINSSVNEMANWVITWINGGKFNDKEILPPAYVSEAMSSQMVIGPGLPDKELPDAYLANYGYGWMITSYRGHYRVEHGGNIDGFSASTSFFPSDSIGIVVLTNQNGSPVTGIVRNMLADRLLKVSPIDWNGRANERTEKAKKSAKEAETSVISNQVKGTNPSHTASEYTGIYSNPGYGTFEIELKNDSLILVTTNGNGWMRHYHYDVFEVLNIDDEDGTVDTSNKDNLKIQFQMNTAGEITSVSVPLQPGLDDIKFTRKPKAKEITGDELKKFEGEYEFAPGQTAKFYIKGDKTLYAFIEGQPEYELVATDKNKFALKILQGYSVLFEENENGEIVSASFIQPNGTFKAKKIK
ncbi:MAG: serine hydrolase [Chitinophagaceae bacterium]|nr:serine hydrolase [Chitinophagaceae bacterium]